MGEGVPDTNPFPGLRPFEFEENHLFFGRDGQTDELLRRLRLHRFLAVVGTSGSGKSSLVRAGLLPDIHGGLMAEAGSSWRVALFKPGNDPIENLASALGEPEVLGAEGDDSTTRQIIGVTLRRSALGLVEVMRQARTDASLLVIADQFEEIFRFKKACTAEHPEDEAAAFVKLLIEAVQQRDVPIYVVLTMRSDYLGDCARFGRLPEAINEGLYLIPRMTRDQRREAIVGPVAVGGGEIAPRLVNRLLNDMGDDPDQLPILQHALMRMWNFWQPDGADAGPIDLEHYERIGTMKGALSQQAEEAYGELTPPAQELAEKIFKRLTEKGTDNREVRRPSTIQELIDITGGVEEEIKAVIDAFRRPGRSFLMPPSDKLLTRDSLIDISHESLIRGWERLRTWVDEEAAAAEVYGRLAETAQLHNQGRAGLWRDPDLQLALDWREQTQPTNTWAQRYHADFDRALKFLDLSQASRDAELATTQRERSIRRRLLQAVIAALAVGFTVMAVGFIVSLIFFHRARIAQRNAEAAQSIAVNQERAARSSALRIRKQNFGDKTTLVYLADRLVQLTAREETAMWHHIRGSTLSALRRRDEAIGALEAVLDLEPQNADARISLGYHYLVAGKADQALAQTDAALERDPTIWIGYQNRGVALAGVGRYAEAAEAIRKSIEMFQHAGTDFAEPELSADIQQATGRTMIVVDERAQRAVSVCQLANVEAFAGGGEFPQRLIEAERQVQQTDTFLIAVNWTELHLKARVQDYGALGAQGAWWERAGFRPWAKRAYDKFQSAHGANRDPRYAKLAGWVSGRLKELEDEKLPDEKPDVETLAFDAWDHENRKDMDESQRSLDRVIETASDNPSFVILRAWFHLRRAEGESDSKNAAKYYKASKEDCDTVLKADQRSASAYRCRSQANQGLRAPKAEIEADMRKVLEHEASDGETMKRLSDLINQDRPDEALRLLEEGLKADVSFDTLPWIYSAIAAIHQTKGRLEMALQSIETAIAIKSTEISFYSTRAEIERKLGKPESEINQRLAAGHRLVGDTQTKWANKSAALEAYWDSLEALVAGENLVPAPPEQRELATAVARISAAIERLGSKEKAAEFWRVVNESGRAPALKQIADAELGRLRKALRPEPQR